MGRFSPIEFELDRKTYKIGFDRWTAQDVKFDTNGTDASLGGIISQSNDILIKSFAKYHPGMDIKEIKRIISKFDELDEEGFGKFLPDLMDMVGSFFPNREQPKEEESSDLSTEAEEE